MSLPLIDCVVIGFAAYSAAIGQGRGFGEESMRLFRRLVPGLFGLSFYQGIAGPVENLVGLNFEASAFWSFVLITAISILLMLKLKGALLNGLTRLGNRLPSFFGAIAGVFRSLATSCLVLFGLSMAPWSWVQDGVATFSWLATCLQGRWG